MLPDSRNIRPYVRPFITLDNATIQTHTDTHTHTHTHTQREREREREEGLNKTKHGSDSYSVERNLLQRERG